MPERLGRIDRLHIITNNVCRRRIFDAKTCQVVEVFLQATVSDQQQQLSWARRTTVSEPAKVTVYGRELPCPLPFRRMDILNSEAAGFLVSLHQFMSWPTPFPELHRIVACYDTADCLDTMTLRLAQQSIIRFGRVSHSLGFLMALPDRQRSVFYGVLPLLEYDTRIAYFVSQVLSPAILNRVHLQAAAVMAQELRDGFLVTPQKTVLDATLRSISNQTALGEFTTYGTMWAVLALMEAATMEREESHSPRPHYSFADGKITITEDLRQRVADTYQALAALVEKFGFRVAPPTSHKLTQHQFEELSLHFARAFLYQIAIATIKQHGQSRRAEVEDFVSGQPLGMASMAGNVPPWSEILAGEDCLAYGVYTKATRDSQFEDPLIKDWTYIPEKVWKELDKELKSWGGWASLMIDQELESNKDEA